MFNIHTLRKTRTGMPNFSVNKGVPQLVTNNEEHHNIEMTGNIQQYYLIIIEIGM